jgi:hypothetical protein
VPVLVGQCVVRPQPFAPVVALDIDGTSGEHHGHFTAFIEQWLGRPMPSATQYTGGVQFHKHLGVSRATYNQAKLAYRQGGMKRSMPVYEGIGDFTRHIRKQGCQVWICTTRPYLRLDNIDPDTRHWLTKRARMQYDAVLYGPHKYVDLVRAVGRERVVMVYDDLPKMIEQALAQDLPVTLRLQPYNDYWNRVDNPISARAHFARNVPDMTQIFDSAWEKFNDK